MEGDGHISKSTKWIIVCFSGVLWICKLDLTGSSTYAPKEKNHICPSPAKRILLFPITPETKPKILGPLTTQPLLDDCVKCPLQRLFWHSYAEISEAL